MEVVDNIQEQPRKFQRIGNGRSVDSNTIGSKEDEEDGEPQRRADDGPNQLHGWHHSRIIRVSRATGGKDRHSKVWTSKGLRDRRVRLSVATAIQFYDLQDRLGVEQPSKAVEWLIKAAADAIAELPSLDTSFPETPKQLSGEKISAIEPGPFDSGEQNQSQLLHVSLSKSACSSNSETSKGSGLSLSRPEVRVNRLKARERARERAQKEKEKEREEDPSRISNHNLNSMTQNPSFTELLAGGIGSVNESTVPMDYFSSGILEPSNSRSHQSSGFSEQTQLGTSLFSVSAGDSHGEHLRNASFVPDGNLIPISSSLVGFHRGPLQSNSPSLLPHLQRFSPVDGSNNLPFFFGAATAAPPLEYHHHYQFSPPFDGRLQLCYGGGSRQSEQKEKGKNGNSS